MAKSNYKFTKEELELLELIMKRLHITQRELKDMERRVQKMIDEDAARKKARP